MEGLEVEKCSALLQRATLTFKAEHQAYTVPLFTLIVRHWPKFATSKHSIYCIPCILYQKLQLTPEAVQSHLGSSAGLQGLLLNLPTRPVCSYVVFRSPLNTAGCEQLPSANTSTASPALIFFPSASDLLSPFPTFRNKPSRRNKTVYFTVNICYKWRKRDLTVSSEWEQLSKLIWNSWTNRLIDLPLRQSA